MIPNNLTGDQLNRFIGGRRRYNLQRKMKAISRRHQMMFLWAKNPHMNQADLARHFGVSRATITRDIKILKSQEHRRKKCPVCNQHYDTGPGLTTQIEVVSDIKRAFDRLGAKF